MLQGLIQYFRPDLAVDLGTRFHHDGNIHRGNINSNGCIHKYIQRNDQCIERKSRNRIHVCVESCHDDNHVIHILRN